MTILEQAQRIRAAMNTAAADLTDEQGLTLMPLFEPWGLKSYAAGDRVRHGDKLYRCIQSHTALENWTPDATPALWAVISLDEWPEWMQPTGAHDAYNKDDKVTYQGARYISEINSNTWAPDVYGWRR